MKDLMVTAEGMPSVSLSGVRYPLFYSILGCKAFAEALGISLEAAVSGAWDPAALTEDHLRAFLRIGLSGGERRRHLCEGGELRTIDETLIERAFDTYHPGELMPLMLGAWSHAPEPPDPPQAPPLLSPGA
jgi:hypothetical protein